METTDDALQPRAQLNMLPDELKTYIARLCADQDVALREALIDAEKRFAGCYPQCTDIYGYRLKVQSSLGALYQTSKEWQKITAPHRFRVRRAVTRVEGPRRADTAVPPRQRLNYRQLCDERFLFDYAHRVGGFVVSLDLTTAATINGFVHLAGAVSLLPNLKQIKVDNYKQVFKTARDPGPHPRSHSAYVMDSAEAAVGRLLNAATDVSMTVADLDQVLQRLSLDARGRLQRLSVQVTTEAFGRLIPLLRTTPRLQFFELRLTGNNTDLTEVVLDALLDNHKRTDKGATVLPALRALKLEYPDISRTVLAFAELFAPTLESLELHIRDYDEDFEVAKLEEPIGFVKEFPALTALTLTGDVEALQGPLASISDDLFPFLKHLRYLPNVFGPHQPCRQGEPTLTQTIPETRSIASRFTTSSVRSTRRE